MSFWKVARLLSLRSTELFIDLLRLPAFVVIFDALCFVFMSKPKKPMKEQKEKKNPGFLIFSEK